MRNLGLSCKKICFLGIFSLLFGMPAAYAEVCFLPGMTGCSVNPDFEKYKGPDALKCTDEECLPKTVCKEDFTKVQCLTECLFSTDEAAKFLAVNRLIYKNCVCYSCECGETCDRPYKTCECTDGDNPVKTCDRTKFPETENFANFQYCYNQEHCFGPGSNPDDTQPRDYYSYQQKVPTAENWVIAGWTEGDKNKKGYIGTCISAGDCTDDAPKFSGCWSCALCSNGKYDCKQKTDQEMNENGYRLNGTVCEVIPCKDRYSYGLTSKEGGMSKAECEARLGEGYQCRENDDTTAAKNENGDGKEKCYELVNNCEDYKTLESEFEGLNQHCYSCEKCDYGKKYNCKESVQTGYKLVNGVCGCADGYSEVNGECVANNTACINSGFDIAKSDLPAETDIIRTCFEYKPCELNGTYDYDYYMRVQKDSITQGYKVSNGNCVCDDGYALNENGECVSTNDLCADYTITELPSKGDDIYNCYEYTACDYEQNRYKKVKNIADGWWLYDDDTCQEIMQCIDIKDTVTLYDSEDVCRNNNKDGCHTTRSYGRKVGKDGYIESYDCYTPDTCEDKRYSSSDCESQGMDQDGEPVLVNGNTCYKCKAQKNCSEIDSNYYAKEDCTDTSTQKCKQVDGISGSDGECYELVAKTCNEINSNYYANGDCTETSTQKCEQVTDTSGSDGDCYKLVAKTCSDINSNYSSDSNNCGAVANYGQSCIATDKKDGNDKTCYVAGCDESVYTYNTTSDNDTHCYDVTTCSVDNKTYYKKVEKSPKDAGYAIDNNTCKYMCEGYTLSKPTDDLLHCYTYTACDYDQNLYKRVEKSPKDDGYEISGDKCVKKTSGSDDGTQTCESKGWSVTSKADVKWVTNVSGYDGVNRYTVTTKTLNNGKTTCYINTDKNLTCQGLNDKLYSSCPTGYNCSSVTFTAENDTIPCYAKGSENNPSQTENDSTQICIKFNAMPRYTNEQAGVKVTAKLKDAGGDQLATSEAVAYGKTASTGTYCIGDIQGEDNAARFSTVIELSGLPSGSTASNIEPNLKLYNDNGTYRYCSWKSDEEAECNESTSTVSLGDTITIGGLYSIIDENDENDKGSCLFYIAKCWNLSNAQTNLSKGSGHENNAIYGTDILDACVTRVNYGFKDGSYFGNLTKITNKEDTDLPAYIKDLLYGDDADNDLVAYKYCGARPTDGKLWVSAKEDYTLQGVAYSSMNAASMAEADEEACAQNDKGYYGNSYKSYIKCAENYYTTTNGLAGTNRSKILGTTSGAAYGAYGFISRKTATSTVTRRFENAINCSENVKRGSGASCKIADNYIGTDGRCFELSKKDPSCGNDYETKTECNDDSSDGYCIPVINDDTLCFRNELEESCEDYNSEDNAINYYSMGDCLTQMHAAKLGSGFEDYCRKTDVEASQDGTCYFFTPNPDDTCAAIGTQVLAGKITWETNEYDFEGKNPIAYQKEYSLTDKVITKYDDNLGYYQIVTDYDSLFPIVYDTELSICEHISSGSAGQSLEALVGHRYNRLYPTNGTAAVIGYNCSCKMENKSSNSSHYQVTGQRSFTSIDYPTLFTGNSGTISTDCDSDFTIYNDTTSGQTRYYMENNFVIRATTRAEAHSSGQKTSSNGSGISIGDGVEISGEE
jgi:hypothetical protein